MSQKSFAQRLKKQKHANWRAKCKMTNKIKNEGEMSEGDLDLVKCEQMTPKLHMALIN